MGLQIQDVYLYMSLTGNLAFPVFFSKRIIESVSVRTTIIKARYAIWETDIGKEAMICMGMSKTLLQDANCRVASIGMSGRRGMM